MIRTGSQADEVNPGDGNDTVYLGGGDDELSYYDWYSGVNNRLSTGADTVYGEGGNDEIYTAAGADKIDGGSGDDTIYAGAGSDNVKGGAGDDEINGEAGADTADQSESALGSRRQFQRADACGCTAGSAEDPDRVEDSR